MRVCENLWEKRGNADRRISVSPYPTQYNPNPTPHRGTGGGDGLAPGGNKGRWLVIAKAVYGVGVERNPGHACRGNKWGVGGYFPSDGESKSLLSRQEKRGGGEIGAPPLFSG